MSSSLFPSDRSKSKSSFNKLESYFSDLSNKKKSKTPEKTAEYYAKNIMPTYKEFAKLKKVFEDKKTGVEYAISFGDFSENWYGETLKFDFDLASRAKAKWDDQLLFVRATKDSRVEHGAPSVGEKVTATSDEGLTISFSVTGSYFQNNQRATGYVTASDFRSFPRVSLNQKE